MKEVLSVKPYRFPNVSINYQKQLLNIRLKGHNMQHSGHKGQDVSKLIMIEIYSKSPVRALGKVLLVTFS